jgi:TRAP-type C4-dicarboxylate transport system substrate-binding protein
MSKFKLALGVLALTVASASMSFAQTYNLKIASYISGQHAMSHWIDDWAAEMTEKSGGRLTFEILHGSQMGPPPKYYDLARNGQADITLVLHGATPNRFPLTEISHLPFMFCSAEQATRVLNDPSLRAEYLEAEHRGVKVLALFMHPPGHIMMNDDPVLSVKDIAGKSIRPASQSVGRYIAALGGNPVGLPPTAMAEALQKGTINGSFIDYGGGALAFQLTPYLQNVTETQAYTVSFGLMMNPDSFNDLPADLQAMIDESFADASGEIGKVWDDLDVVGKNIMVEGGVAIHMLSDEARAQFEEIGSEVSATYISDLDDKGLSGSDVLAKMLELREMVGSVGAGCQ